MKKLTDEETAILKKKAAEILSVCRRNILNKYPFIGSIALRMNMVPIRDVRVRTACTDGDSVYFDIAFLSSLTDDERNFVLAHEVWHAVMLHLIRRQNRNPQLFNIASDKEVNYMLKQDGMNPPPELCFPEGNEVGKCAEEIYEMMLKKMKNNLKNMSSSNGSNKNAQPNGSSSNQSQKNSKKRNGSGTGNSSNSNDDSSNDPNSGNKNGDLKGQFDRHIYDGGKDDSTSKNDSGKNDGSNDTDENGQPNNYSTIVDKYGEVGLDSDYQPKIPRNFADKMRETVISEANRIEKMKGNLPAHIKSLVKKFTSAEVKWQEVLAQFVTRCYNSGNRSWIPPNRRYVHNGLYLQSRQADKIRLAVICDTSGSTMGDRTTFLGELYSLIKSFSVFDLTILDVDAEVNDVKHYTQDDDMQTIIELGEYEMRGGGGTSLLCGFEKILDDQIECDAVICLTDGFIDNIPKNPTGLPTLWIITKDGTEDFNDWGQKIRLTQSDNDL